MMGCMKPQDLLQEFGSPLYVYDARVVRSRCNELQSLFPDFRLYFACKANTNPLLVKLIHEQGFRIETVSPGEIAVARGAGVPIKDLTFTCGNIPEKELLEVVNMGVRTHLDSLTQVEQLGKHFPGRKISVRLNLGVGAGHHSHVITGGPESKFGIDISHLKTLKSLAKKYNLHIAGLHQHIGSNILDVPTFLKAMDVLFKAALEFPALEHIDFGGGIGVPYSPGAKRLDLKKLGAEVHKRVTVFTKKYGRSPEMSFEPGRFLVAESGTLYTTVVDVKKNPKKTFVGIDSGMGHLVRPAMYGSYHQIDNVSRPKAKMTKVTIAGMYCESGDVFAKDRPLAMPALGDILAVRNAGAYGYVMSSDYNLRPRPKEVLVDGETVTLTPEARK